MNEIKEWKCEKCDELLGTVRNNKLYLAIAASRGRAGAQYILAGAFDVLAVCRSCATINVLASAEDHGKIDQQKSSSAL